MTANQTPLRLATTMCLEEVSARMQASRYWRARFGRPGNDDHLRCRPPESSWTPAPWLTAGFLDDCCRFGPWLYPVYTHDGDQVPFDLVQHPVRADAQPAVGVPDERAWGCRIVS
jgi:hypothetical protein